MRASLVMFKADGERRDFPINKPVITIGRKHTCDLRIPLGIVSREHCRVELNDDELKVRDLGSSNGTYHNDQRVQEAKLGAGDTIVIGPVHFTVVVDGMPADIAEPVKTILPEGSEEVASGNSSVDALAAASEEDSDAGISSGVEASASASQRGVEIEDEPLSNVLDEDIEDVVDPTVDLDLAEEEDPIAALEALAGMDSGDEDDDDFDPEDALSALHQDSEEDEKHK